VDCYSTSPRPLIVTQFFSVVRQIISFTVPFWSPVLSERFGYGRGIGIETGIAVGFYVLVSIELKRVGRALARVVEYCCVLEWRGVEETVGWEVVGAIC
jgi:hypothetical protein